MWRFINIRRNLINTRQRMQHFHIGFGVVEIAGAKNKLRFHVGVLGRVQTLFLHAGHVQDVYFRHHFFIGPISSIFDILTFCLMWWVFHANTPETQTLFQSGWFVVGLLSQTLIVHMIRTRRVPFIQSCASWPLMIMTVIVMIVGIALPFSPLASYLQLQALPLSYFPWLVAILAGYMTLTQLVKGFYSRRYGWQ